MTNSWTGHEEDLEFINVSNSQSVTWIAFNPTTNSIIVTFKTGATYAYEGSREIWEDFKKADSKGSFVHIGLKGLKYRKVTEPRH